MNFFEAQDQAHRRSRWLILWFIIAVIATLATLYVLTVVLYFFWLGRFADTPSLEPRVVLRSGHELGVFVASVMGFLMIGGSVYQILRLRGGGSVVARDMGARLVDGQTRDVKERRLINVVQEMAIASGVPVPEIWIMDSELAINAFAAGTDPNNSVVAVTRGTLENLDRTQLQGVVAHEFSHILNGDMRLNVQLLGWLHGLLLISLMGKGMLSVLRHVRVSSSDRDKGGPSLALVLVLAGAFVWLIGSVGVFFGRIIQAALSRQREFLADASAVQFTRDPDSIAGALIKIGQQTQMSMISSHAGELQHMFFSASGSWVNRMLATHPPLEQRIRAVKPQWDGTFSTDHAAPNRSDLASTDARQLAPLHHSQTSNERSREWGESRMHDLPAARLQLQQMGEEAQMLTQEQSVLLVLALLMSQSRTLPDSVVQKLTPMIGEAIEALPIWQQKVEALNVVERIVWFDLAMPALRRFSQTFLQEFLIELEQVSRLDGDYSMFDFMLIHAIHRRIRSISVPAIVEDVRFWKLQELNHEIALLLAMIECEGDERSWQAASELFFEFTQTTLSRVEADYSQLVVVLDQLSLAASSVKNQILRLVEVAIAADGRISAKEYELMRIMADAMGLVLAPHWARQIDMKPQA